MLKFNQFEISDDPLAQINDHGWLYYPKSCVNGGCKLAVIMHGCTQWPLDFAMPREGWISLANNNDIITLFPNSQVYPMKCWDMINIYDMETFATNQGPQE